MSEGRESETMSERSIARMKDEAERGKSAEKAHAMTSMPDDLCLCVWLCLQRQTLAVNATAASAVIDQSSQALKLLSLMG